MNALFKILFTVFSTTLIFSYLIYPLLIKLISSFFKNRVINKSNNSNSVSILISVYNEEKVIEKRIDNLKNLQLDFNNIEVLIGSDCSTDKTNEILRSLINKYSWLSIHLYNARRGKVSVLNDLVNEAKNEIIIFSDANTIFEVNSVNLLVSHFNDEKVGGVCGRLILVNSEENGNTIIQEKNYWDYETFIKKSEGKCGILISSNGAIFAIRKKMYIKIPTDKAITDDLFITLAVLQNNYKFVYEFNALAYEEPGKNITDEFKRKVRFSASNFQTLLYFKRLLFSKNILLSFAFWSHKVLRWATPFFLILIFALNLYLFNDSIMFNIVLFFQIIFYFSAICGYIFSKFDFNFKIFAIPFYFSMTNIALLLGFFKFIFNKHTAYWQSTPR